jgi:hypothetical protein
MPSIADLRSALGAFANDKSDEQLLQLASTAAGVSPGRIASEYGYKPTESGIAGLRTGAAIDRYQAGLYGLGEAVTGADFFRRGREANEFEANVASERARSQGAIESFEDVQNVSDLPSYIGGLAIGSAPYMIEALGGGLAARGLMSGTRAALGTARATGDAAAAGQAARTLRAGQTTGGVVAAYPSAVGGILQDQREQAGETDLTAAAALGVPFATLNALGIEGALARQQLARSGINALDNLQGLRGGLARAGASGVRTGLVEGGTETLQEMTSQLGRMAVDPNEAFLSEAALGRYKESAIGGALLGGTFGGATGFGRSESYRAPMQERDLTQTQTQTDISTEQEAPARTGTLTGLDRASLLGNPYAAANPLGGAYANSSLVSPAILNQETDLTTPAAPAATVAGTTAPVTETKPAVASIFSPLDEELNGLGIKPTKKARGIYEYMVSKGIDPASPEAEPVLNALAQNKPNEARTAVAEIIRARSPRGAGIPSVSQPAGGLGGGSAVVPGVVGTAGPSVAPTGGNVQPAGAAGAPVQQAGAVPVVASQPPTTVTTGASSGTQASQTIQAAPQGQAAAPVQPAAPIAPNTTLRLNKQEALPSETDITNTADIARMTGNAGGIDAVLEDEAGMRVDQQDFTADDLEAVIEQHLSTSKEKERDRQILNAYLTARRAVPVGYKGNIAKEIAASFGVSESRVRQVGNPELLANIAEAAGFSRDQVFDALGIQSAKKAAATELGKLEGELSRLEGKATPSQADIDRMSELSEQIERVKGNIQSGDLAAALKNIGIEGEAGEVFAGMDDAREWQKASTAGSQMAVDLVAAADAIEALKAAVAELEQLNLPNAAAAAAENINKLTAKYDALVAAATKPKGERRKAKAKTEAAQVAAEEKDAAQEAEAAKFRAERAAKLESDRKGLAVGDTVMNPKLGTGVVKSFAGDGDATTVTVAFQSGQTKELSVKLAKLEKTNAVQVESAASVPVQPKAEAGQGVGSKVRRAPKPAEKSQAPTQILTSAEQAGQAWDKVAAEFPEAPKFADLTKAQQNTFIGYGEGNWERGDVELELTKLARTAAPKKLANEPVTIDVEARIIEETVAPQVAALPAPQVTRLENHYGVKRDTPEFLAKVKADVVLFATKGAEAVAGAIRDVIKAIHAGVLSVAMIFNPTAVSQIESFVVIPQETRTTTTQVLAELPAEVQGMSEAGKQAYATLIPALKGKIGDKFVTIADKPSGRVFVFKANGELVLQKKALFGLAKGDLYKGNNDLKQNRVTPAGLFGIHVVDAAKGGAAATTAGEYDFGKVFALDDPDATVTFMHSVWLKESDAAKRAAALKNDSAADSRYSFGCINVDKETFKDMVGKYSNQMDGSKLFVVPDVQSTVNDFITGNVANDRLVREGVQPVIKTTTTPVKSATKTTGADRTVAAKEEEQTTTTATRAQESFMRMSRQSTRLFATDLYLGKENVPGQPQYGRELRNPVTLNDGTRLDGFTSQDQSVFSGYERNGQRITMSQDSVNPADIKSSRDSNRTANALKAALSTSARQSRRSVRTTDQDGVDFESVEASLEDLSKYSEGIAAGIRGLQNSGMGNAVDAIDSWMVTFSPVKWDAIYTMVDGKRTIIYNGLILKDKQLATTATLHEVGHGVDEVQGGAGKFSNDKEFKVSRVNGELMAMRPGTAMDELLNHFEDSSETSPIGALLNYPLDMSDANNRSLTIQELREEVFAQVWAFSNMNGGMDYLRDNLPATHAFMEKVHEQVKATNYTAAQGAQQGAQSGQVQAGQQGAQPTGAVSRASRQAKVDKAISQLPKQAQKPVNDSINILGDWARKGLDRLVFTSDLIKRAVDVGINSAAKFESLLAKRSTKARELEREVERVADMYATIEEAHKGDGPNSVNQFIFESTRTGKWGYDSGSFKADPKMAAQFSALGPKAQAYVKAIFTHGNKMLSAKKKAVIDYTSSEYDARIAAETDLLKKAALVRDKANDLKKFARLFKIREGIPYAPIKRFGDHVVVAKSQEYIDAVKANDSKRIKQLEKDPDHYHVSFTETKNEARNLAAQLEDQGFFNGGEVSFKERSVADNELFGSRDSLGAITRLRSMADAKANAGDKGAAQIQRMVSDMYLQALAEGSARKSEMRRRGVSGEIDMLRSFAAQGRADANFVASVEYNPQVQDAIQAMRKEANSGRGDLNRKSEILNEITRRHESSMDVTPTPNIAKLTRLSSIYYLATSPAYYLQNLTQPWMMSVPAMAGRHDYGRTSTALFTAYGQLGGVMNSARYDQQFDFNKVPADVRNAIQELVNRGKIDIGLETELGEFKIDGDSKFSKGWNKVDKFLRVAVQKVESINRLSTAMAAYRLELERAKKDPKIADPEATAINYADRILTETHGDYSSFNAPRFFNNPLGKVALQFRKFQLIQLTYYAKLLKDAGLSTEEKRAATKALVYSLGHTGLLAGAMGLPGYSAIAWAIGAMFGDDDEPLDVTAELRKFIGDEDMANLIMRGAPTLAGVDISGKVGAGNMLSIMPFSNADLTTKAGILEAVGTAIGGAPIGMVARVADGLGQMLSGNWYKGMEQILPKGLGDAAKAYRISSEGTTRRNGDLVLPASEVSAWETLVQAMGIQPVQQSVVMERQQNTLDMNQFYQDRSTKVKAEYVKAVRAGKSTAEARAAWTKLQEARVKNGYTRQPLSELIRAPQTQAKRERQVIDGVQFNKTNKRFVEEQV